MRVLLPVYEVIFRFDTQRVTRNGSAAVRGGTQTDDLPRECDQPVVVVNRLVVEHHPNSHTAPKKKKRLGTSWQMSSGTSSFQAQTVQPCTGKFSKLPFTHCQVSSGGKFVGAIKVPDFELSIGTKLLSASERSAERIVVCIIGTPGDSDSLQKPATFL